MKVIKNYLYNVGYQILLMLTPLITTPYVSRVLGAHNNGINTYTNGWVTFFYLVGQLGITLYGNREIAYKRENKLERSKLFWEMISLQIITSTLSLLLYLIIFMFISSNLKEYFLMQSLWIVAYGIDISWYFMGMEDFKKTVTRNTVMKILSVILIFLLVKSKNDLIKYIFLLGFSQLAGSITLWPYLKGSVQWVKFKELHPFKHFYPALLLFIPTITTQIYFVVNRIMLGKMGPQSAVAQFDFGDKIVKLVLAIVTATGTVMLPHIANKFAVGDTEGIKKSLNNSFDYVTALSIPMMFGLMAISNKFSVWFLGNQYGPTGNIIFLEAPAILIIAWSNVTGVQYLMPIHKEHEYTISVTVGAIINILVNFFLIPKFGANGAALATVISEFSILLVQWNFIKNDISIFYLYKPLWKYLLSGFVMFIIISKINHLLSMNIITLLIEGLLGIVIYGLVVYLLKAPILFKINELVKNRVRED
ncbi:polysaccharide biosynthesis C-terminal domain-containing protein [Limosilactobacillus reuteri]|uniref:oligosaccharide flippase family protein n=1 Tax=Limosilactobacillus reuteri TaxID=1598 RepID=UPI001E3BB901|nr:flippase [Limosilactobacillus reuteri]MCC4396616.1 polysaccharide biosynthesis C-terminal domain-containing protein [Limosilactobacillus reuteri]